MRRQIAVLVLAATSALALGCATTVNGRPVAGHNSRPVPPVEVSALNGLLLDSGQINQALDATAMKVWFSTKAMWDWSSGISDPACLAVDGPAQKKVYVNSGWTAVRGQRLDDSVDDSKKRDHYAIQAVIAYPSARDASAFYNSSARNWPACSKRRFSDVTPGQPDVVWTVSAITHDNGMLSTSEVQEGGDGWACQRALTVRNNVVIDTVACSYSPSRAPAAGPAIDIAHQIAAKVATR